MQEVVGSTPILSTIKAPDGAFFMNFSVYIIYSASLDKYYTGSCQDFSIRLLQHNAGRNKSTKGGMPWVLKYEEKYATNQQARNREADIKKMKSRKFIEQLISSVD
jgi:putative endonuclease